MTPHCIVVGEVASRSIGEEAAARSVGEQRQRLSWKKSSWRGSGIWRGDNGGSARREGAQDCDNSTGLPYTTAYRLPLHSYLSSSYSLLNKRLRTVHYPNIYSHNMPSVTKHSVRICCSSGAVTDRHRALKRIAANEDVDVINGDWMSEYNMTKRGAEKHAVSLRAKASVTAGFFYALIIRHAEAALYRVNSPGAGASCCKEDQVCLQHGCFRCYAAEISSLMMFSLAWLLLTRSRVMCCRVTFGNLRTLRIATRRWWSEYLGRMRRL